MICNYYLTHCHNGTVTSYKVISVYSVYKSISMYMCSLCLLLNLYVVHWVSLKKSLYFQYWLKQFFEEMCWGHLSPTVRLIDSRALRSVQSTYAFNSILSVSRDTIGREMPATPIFSLFINSLSVLLTVSAYSRWIVGDVVLWGSDGVLHLLCSWEVIERVREESRQMESSLTALS